MSDIIESIIAFITFILFLVFCIVVQSLPIVAAILILGLLFRGC